MDQKVKPDPCQEPAPFLLEVRAHVHVENAVYSYGMTKVYPMLLLGGVDSADVLERIKAVAKSIGVEVEESEAKGMKLAGFENPVAMLAASIASVGVADMGLVDGCQAGASAEVKIRALHRRLAEGVAMGLPAKMGEASHLLGGYALGGYALEQVSNAMGKMLAECQAGEIEEAAGRARLSGAKAPRI